MLTPVLRDKCKRNLSYHQIQIILPYGLEIRVFLPIAEWFNLDILMETKACIKLKIPFGTVAPLLSSMFLNKLSKQQVFICCFPFFSETVAHS